MTFRWNFYDFLIFHFIIIITFFSSLHHRHLQIIIRKENNSLINVDDDTLFYVLKKFNLFYAEKNETLESAYINKKKILYIRITNDNIQF